MWSRHKPTCHDSVGITDRRKNWTEMDMKMKWEVLAAAALALLMSGCASMSGEECIAADWSAVGYEDGARGYTTDRFSTYRKACSKEGITPDFAAYQAGRDQGLVEYCQPGRGYNIGVNGGRYQGVCHVDLEPDFLDAYNAGYHLYTLRSNVSRSKSQIDAKQRELKKVREEMRDMEAALIAAETTTEDRVVLLADLKEYSERTGRLEAEIEELHVQHAYHRVELENYQAQSADFGY
jgi:hypothetical protein